MWLEVVGTAVALGVPESDSEAQVKITGTFVRAAVHVPSFLVRSILEGRLA